MWCGASIDPLGCAVTFNRACCKPDEVAGSDLKGKWFWFGEQPFLKVNLNGKRFCNESGPYDYMLHSAYMQPYHTYVDIWDSDYVEQVKQLNEVGCCRLYPFDNGAPSNMPVSLMGKKFEELEEAGYIQKADTMEELAEKLNLPVEATVETWNRYNMFAEQGKDEDYNKEPYRLTSLTHPPYYGVRTGSWFLATIDGISINTDMHAVDEAEADRGLVHGRKRLGRVLLGELSQPYDGSCRRSHDDVRPPRRHAGRSGQIAARTRLVDIRAFRPEALLCAPPAFLCLRGRLQ